VLPLKCWILNFLEIQKEDFDIIGCNHMVGKLGDWER
jgi:hypothetical protein